MILGHIHFDTPSSNNKISEFLATQENAEKIFRNEYVKLQSNDKNFIGRIVEGPYFIPEEVSRESAFAQTSILKGEEFKAIPNFYTLARVEILGEGDNGKLLGTNTRPLPKTPVEQLDTETLRSLIGISGDIKVGELLGYPGVEVTLDSNSKKVLPRNIGIFGTVGSGKSNTAQVLIEETSKAGYAIIVFDVEGEYVEMDKPSQETTLLEKLKHFKLKPVGLNKDKFEVYHPSGSDKSSDDSIEFDIEFDQVSPFIISELIELSEPQEGAFLKMIDLLRAERERRKKDSNKSKAIEFLEGGGSIETGYTLKDLLTKLPDMKDDLKVGDATLWALHRKLKSLERTGIFDVIKKPIEIETLMAPGKVSVIDVSTVTNDYAKNIAIAEILRRAFHYKINHQNSPRTLILIEEAHTFISKESQQRMTATMDMLKLIARRGRKRWLCLGFVSQQPSHIPDEIFELCNTRFIHGIKSEFNLNPLRHTSGDVISEIWDMVPGLGPGQAVITSPQFNHTILVDIRPSVTKRRLVE